MGTRSAVGMLGVSGALVLIACGRGREAIPGESAVAATAGAVLGQAGGAIARPEVPDLLDSARSALSRNDLGAAAGKLRDAAARVRLSADSASGDVQSVLAASATALERLAGDVSGGGPGVSQRLAPVFAQAHFADIRNRCTRALALWNAKDGVLAGQELLIAAGAFERAVVERGATLDSAGGVAAARFQSMAEELAAGGIVPDDRFEATMASFDKVVHGMEAIQLRKE